MGRARRRDLQGRSLLQGEAAGEVESDEEEVPLGKTGEAGSGEDVPDSSRRESPRSALRDRRRLQAVSRRGLEELLGDAPGVERAESSDPPPDREGRALDGSSSRVLEPGVRTEAPRSESGGEVGAPHRQRHLRRCTREVLGEVVEDATEVPAVLLSGALTEALSTDEISVPELHRLRERPHETARKEAPRDESASRVPNIH